MNENVPPPPGGYGAGPYRAPQPPPPFPPDEPGPPRNTGRWAAGGIGLALLAVRACLLFARLDSPTPDYSSYTPLTLPTYDPLGGAFGDAAPFSAPKLSLGGGHLALGSGDAFVYDDVTGQIKDGAGRLVCAGYCTTGNLVVAGDRAYWVSFLDEELRGVRLSGGDAPEKVTELHDPGTKLASDGVSVFVVQEASSSEKQSIVKVNPVTGKQAILASVEGTVDDLQVAGGKVFFTFDDRDTDGKGGWHMRSVPTTGGTVTKVADPALVDVGFVGGAIGGGYYYLAYGDFALPEHVGRVPIGGGKFETIYDAGPDELLGPIAADASGVYLAHRVEATWAIARLAASAAGSAGSVGGAKLGFEAKDIADGILGEPVALATLKRELVYTTAAGVARVPKAPAKSP